MHVALLCPHYTHTRCILINLLFFLKNSLTCPHPVDSLLTNEQFSRSWWAEKCNHRSKISFHSCDKNVRPLTFVYLREGRCACYRSSSSCLRRQMVHQTTAKFPPPFLSTRPLPLFLLSRSAWLLDFICWKPECWKPFWTVVFMIDYSWNCPLCWKTPFTHNIHFYVKF